MTVALSAKRPDQASSRALTMSTAAFTVCFAVWTIFSIIGVRIRDELGLSETEFGLLVGTPILLFLIVAVSLAWMHVAIRRIERRSLASATPALPLAAQ